MRAGWKKVESGALAWYRRDVDAGPLSICLDLWSIDEDDREWAFSFNNSRPERIPAGSAEKVMNAAESLLAGYLRNAARALRKEPVNG